MGRPPGTKNPPGHKAGGRVAKSLDRQARQLISNDLAANIMQTFQALDGVQGMIEWASIPANKTIFYTQILARLMPAPMRDDADVQVNILNNIGHLSTVEAASRVAFSLRLGIEAQKELDKQREELL